jgi:uncharacterized protein YfaS (alpha-2-macroglobulin family)
MALSLCARAEIADTDLVDAAASYQRSLRPLPEKATVASVLTELNKARKASDAEAVVRWSEALVVLGDTSSAAWLGLSKAWVQVDPTARKGLGAAIRAVQLASDNGDRIEALLQASTFLRKFLDRDRARYDEAVAVAQTLAVKLELTQNPDVGEDFVPPDPQNPDGRIKTIENKIAAAKADSAAAATDIARTASALDEVYREIQASMPALNAKKLQQGDGRLAFEPVADGVPFYPVDGNDVRACIRFDRKLNENSREYGANLVLTDDGGVNVVVEVQAKGDTLCMLGLGHESTYRLTLKVDLASADGAVLGKTYEYDIELPDLPERVAFGDGEFILPRSGPGELPVSLTNKTEAFPLALHRLVDRSLYRHLALRHIANGIPTGEYEELLTKFSEVLWTGKAKRDLDPKERNTTVRTFVPVRTIIEDRKLWLKDATRKGAAGPEGMTSVPAMQPVDGISDSKLSIAGTYRASLPDTGRGDDFVPGVYALVTPIKLPSPRKTDDCEEGSEDEECKVYAAQWFVISDIGLTFYEGQNDFTVVARSLATGGPVSGATIQLVAQSNRLLSELATDAKGIAKFPLSLTRGKQSNALIAILADTGSDFNFLKFGPERLDLSRLGVGSSLEANREQAFLYTDRGIYQPGETINAFALLRDRGVTDPTAVASTLRLDISDYAVTILPGAAADWKDGGLLQPLRIPKTAKPGPAVVKLMSGDNLVAETRVQIGRIRPDRARLNFNTDGKTPVRIAAVNDATATIEGKIKAQYLYGSKGTSQGAAARLKTEVSVRVVPVQQPTGSCYADFTFGKFDDKALPTLSRSFYDFTDDNGLVSLPSNAIKLPATTKPLEAVIDVTMYDASGPITAGQLSLAVPPKALELGISTLPRIKRTSSGGYQLNLDVATLDTGGRMATGRDLDVVVERERESYSWVKVDGTWQHVVARPREQVISRKVRIEHDAAPRGRTPGCAGYVAFDDVAPGLGEGRYVITVADAASGAVASVRFNTGVAQTSVDDLEPNLFVLSSAKKRYTPGEQVSLSIDAPFDTGQALVAIAGADILEWIEADIVDSKATVSFEANRNWAGQGLHALATAFKADPGGERMLGPARAIGATYFEVSNDGGAFAVSLRRDGPLQNDYVRPGEKLNFDVCLDGPDGACGGPESGEAYAAAFVVDEGLLSLTGHAAKFHALQNVFFGKQKMSLRVMDNYGRLLLKEGGDRPGRPALGNYTSRRIVATTQGPVKMVDGRVSFSFDNNQLQTGSLEIYVVAWSKTRIASTVHTVAVRNLLVSNLEVPEFFLAGDKPILPLRMENIGVADFSGDFALSFRGADGIGIALSGMDGKALPTNASGAFLVPVPRDAPRDLLLSLDIPQTVDGMKDLTLAVSVEGASDILPSAERDRSWTLDIRPSRVMAQEFLPPIAIGSRPASIERMLEGVINGRYDPATVKVTARFAANDNSLRLASDKDAGSAGSEPVLDNLVWRGLVDLQEAEGSHDKQLSSRVQASIDGVQALQIVDGAFVPYRTDGDFLASEVGFDKTPSNSAARHGLLRNASALDFLLRARDAGFVVSTDAVRNSVAYVKARVDDAVGADPATGLLCAFDTRYAMLLLAQQNRLAKSDIDAIEKCDQAQDDGDDAASDDAASDERGADTGDQVDRADGDTDQPSGSVFSELVTLAVASQFGEEVDAKATLAAYYPNPGEYLADLDDYRKAIALSMLANAQADGKLVQTIAESFLQKSSTIDLRTRAWLARSVADLSGPAPATLRAADLELSEDDVLALTDRADGIVESDPVDFRDLQGIEVAKTGGPDARLHLMVSGQLIDPASSLPASSFRKRFFIPKSGKEVQLDQEKLSLGERLIVVLEANSDAFVAFDDQDISDIGSAYGPLVVEAMLPSGMSIASSDLAGLKAVGEFGRLKMIGTPRSIETGTQGWRAILVPKSNNAVMTHGSFSDDEGEGSGEGNGDAAAPAEGANGAGAAADDPADADVEFRQAFMVTVSASGSFLFPASTIDPLDFPGNTLVSDQMKFEVPAPNGSP